MAVDKSTKTQVVGRFAPSPTGPLHFGSLVAALGSYLFARHDRSKLFLPVADLDPPRVVSGSADEIRQLLELCGFDWDGEILYQSERFEYYRHLLLQLKRNNLVFDCSCSRRELIASAPHSGEDGPIYPGTCRQGAVGQRPERAFRLRVPDEEIICQDLVFGPLRQNLQHELGDFVLQRADGLFAYQLAVVADDIASGINQVVRGADLLSSTPRQVYLYRCLQQPAPDYVHLPLALGDDAQKLSKRHGKAAIITGKNYRSALWNAFEFLGQAPPPELFGADGAELLLWGRENFSAAKIDRQPRPAPDFDRLVR